MPYKDCPYHEIEILINFDYLNVLKPNEHTEDYHIRQPNDEKSLFEIEDKKHIYVGEKVFTFETNDKIVKYSLDLGFNDVKFPYANGEETFTLCYIKNIFLFENMKIQQKKMNISFCIKK